MKALLAVLLVALSVGVAKASPAQIVIMPTAIEPAVLRVPAGERVDFVNRTRRNVHVEFGVDPRQHEVVQISPTGPISAVFHRPGTHPYAVHVYGGGGLTTLTGRVEVVANPEHPWEGTRCPVVVKGVCFEP
jgi:plastocyanin